MGFYHGCWLSTLCSLMHFVWWLCMSWWVYREASLRANIFSPFEFIFAARSKGWNNHPYSILWALIWLKIERMKIWFFVWIRGEQGGKWQGIHCNAFFVFAMQIFYWHFSFSILESILVLLLQKWIWEE